MPIAIFATRYSSGYRLPDAGFAIPIGLAFGVGALLLMRSARARNDRALGRLGGERAIRLSRNLAILGICIAVSGVVAIAVYEVLRSRN